MGIQTIVSGYIQTPLDEDEYNFKVIKNFKYDKSPLTFRNIFYGAIPGHKISMITFACSYYNIQADWNYWQDRFEELLGKLKALIASVLVDDEDFPGKSFSLIYACNGFAKSTTDNLERKCEWTRTKFDYNDEQVGSDEDIIL